MDSNWILAVLPMLLLLVAAIFMRSLTKTWLEPGALFPLITAIYFTAPLVFVPFYFTSTGALWWLLVSGLTFVIGSLTVVIGLRNKIENRKRITLGENVILAVHNGLLIRIRAMTLLTSLLGFLASIGFIIYIGKGLNILFELNRLVQTGSEVSIQRYAGYNNPPVYLQLLLAFAYISPILGGIIFAIRKNRADIYISLASLMPAILVFMIQTTRASALIGVVLWTASYFSTSNYISRGNNLRLFTRKKLVVLSVLILILIIMFLAGEVIRKGVTPSIESLSETISLPRSRSSLFGHLAAFSEWFQQEWRENVAPSYGAYTFSGVFDALGIKERVQGIHTEKVWTEGNASTNIFSQHRDFIEDFGFAGALLFLFLFGVFSSYIFNKVSYGSYVLIPLLIAIYAFLLFPIISIFNYNSILFAFLFVFLYFLISKRYWRTTGNEY